LNCIPAPPNPPCWGRVGLGMLIDDIKEDFSHIKWLDMIFVDFVKQEKKEVIIL
jgi:hypothetical protein